MAFAEGQSFEWTWTHFGFFLLGDWPDYQIAKTLPKEKMCPKVNY